MAAADNQQMARVFKVNRSETALFRNSLKKLILSVEPRAEELSVKIDWHKVKHSNGIPINCCIIVSFNVEELAKAHPFYEDWYCFIWEISEVDGSIKFFKDDLDNPYVMLNHNRKAVKEFKKSAKKYIRSQIQKE